MNAKNESSTLEVLKQAISSLYNPAMKEKSGNRVDDASEEISFYSMVLNVTQVPPLLNPRIYFLSVLVWQDRQEFVGN